MYPVTETFHSLQGEGHHCGRSAFFIRLAGCDVGCPWCDTKHSWQQGVHPTRHVEQLVQEAVDAARDGACFTVITGGEPLQHNLETLTSALSSAELPRHLETSGVGSLSGRFDWITLSPKAHRPPKQDMLQQCDELKVVVHNPADLKFAEAMANQTPEGTVLLLQPGWGHTQAMTLAIEYIKYHPSWRLSLQTHKWLQIR